MATQETLAPDIEVTGPGEVRTTCLKCRERVKVQFGDLSEDAARAAVAKIDRTPMECPGFHVELSGWRGLWQLDKCIEAVYGGGQ